MATRGNEPPASLGDLLGEIVDSAEVSTKSELQKRLPMPRSTFTPTVRKRAEIITSFADYVRENDERRIRTEALRMARNIALAGLPKRPSRERDLTRTLRLGAETWLQVTYSTTKGGQLPYGEDRFVLAGIQHLAIANGSPVVFFERVGQLLKMFGVGENQQGLRLLRERFKRVATLSISLTFATTEAGLSEQDSGDHVFVIRRWALPTRDELSAEQAGQLVLPSLLQDEALGDTPYGVILSEDFWQHLQDESQHMLVPLELLRLFVDRPIGWDYLCFLVSRCGRARSHSVIHHDVLMGLFKDSKEPDRQVIARLKKYHREIMLATGGRLKAEIVELGYLPSTGGRPKKRWGLRVGPSKTIVWSGRKSLPVVRAEELV